MRTIVGVLAIMISGVASDELTAKPQDSNMPALGVVGMELMGSWRMIEIEERGRKIMPPIEMVFTFGQDTVEQEAGGRSQSSKYKLHAKNPTHLDILRERGGETRVFKMIFSVKGNTLKICSGRPGAARPEKFSSENDHSIQLFRRVKQER